MPKDKRIFSGSVSIRMEDRRVKLELAPAELHGGGEDMFRVRMGRRWLDAPPDANGKSRPLFFDRARLADCIAAHVFADSVAELPAAPPDIPRNSRVSVKFWHQDRPRQEGVYTATPPFRGFDGRFYVFVMTYEAGFIAVPLEDVTLVRRARS